MLKQDVDQIRAQRRQHAPLHVRPTQMIGHGQRRPRGRRPPHLNGQLRRHPQLTPPRGPRPPQRNGQLHRLQSQFMQILLELHDAIE